MYTKTKKILDVRISPQMKEILVMAANEKNRYLTDMVSVVISQYCFINRIPSAHASELKLFLSSRAGEEE